MSRPEPIPALTGLRIVGAGWVVLFHFKDTIVGASAALRPAEPFFSLGTSGVPLFFLLSGYIIWHNYGSARLFRSVREPVRFFWRRVARLWPVNVLTLCLAAPLIMNAVIVHGFWGQPLPSWYSVSGFIGSALMIQVLRYPEVQYPWNQPSWSLTAEMVAYVVFPLILLFALRIRAAKLRWLCVPLALVLASVAYLPGFSFPYRWLVELLVLFVAGVLLRVAGRPRTSLAMSILQVAAPIVIIVACFSPAYTFIPTLLAVWVWSLAAPDGWMVRLMTTRPLQVAGLSSYSVYMLHWVILGYAYLLVEQSPPTGVGKKVFVVIALLAVAFGSWLCWRFFETPGRKVLNAAFERVWPGPRPVTVTEETLEHEAGVERHHPQ